MKHLKKGTKPIMRWIKAALLETEFPARQPCRVTNIPDQPVAAALTNPTISWDRVNSG